ncbi:MAG: hypothetical protein LJE65_17220 [Desulfobacteraceae bacterium]|nr:hypothetical protein [Desulfobacteraceae bacterium]
MPELSHQELEKHLRGLASKDRPAPVYLLYGDAYRIEKSLESLLEQLLEERERLLHYEPVAEEPGSVQAAVDRLNTFSLVPGKKVVALLDSSVFHSKRNMGELIGRARQAFEAESYRKAADLLLEALSFMDLSVEEAREEKNRKRIASEDASDSGEEWISDLLQRCREWELEVPEPRREDQLLARAVEKGFPAGHVLILTAESVDKRRQLFRLMRERGVVLDCGIPAGGRMADRKAREAVFADTARSILSDHGKSMTPEALHQIGELVGSDLRSLERSLEKLIAFSGDRDPIDIEDVSAVVERSRKDPLYVFTDSVTDRNTEKALFTMRSLLTDPDFGHPLPLMAALANQMRRLLVIRSFLEQDGRRLWHSNQAYPEFQRQVLPAFERVQDALADRISHWQETGLGRASAVQGSRKKKKAVGSDLLVSRRLKSPYPLYLAFQKAGRFQRSELLQALRMLQEADRAVKTSGRDPVRELEQIVLFICRPAKRTGNPHP